MNTVKQNGFGAVAVVIVAVVACGLALGGWYVYNSGERAEKSRIGPTATITDGAQEKIGKEVPAGGIKLAYKEVPELGIKIKLTNETQDLTVKVLSPVSAGFSLQSFLDATANADTVASNDGTSGCLSRVSVSLYAPDQRRQLENDPIQAFNFDMNDKPLAGQWLVQLSDKRYARFSAYQAACVKGGEHNDDALRKRESDIKGILLHSLPENISSL